VEVYEEWREMVMGAVVGYARVKVYIGDNSKRIPVYDWIRKC
jgi:hypothetical protein